MNAVVLISIWAGFGVVLLVLIIAILLAALAK